MRKFLFFVLAAVSLTFALNSCTGSSDSKEQGRRETPFNGADSTAVLDLVNDYMTKVQNKDYDGAVAMLYEFHDSVYHEISDSAKQKMIAQHKVFPVLRYKVAHIEVDSFRNASITCSIEFFEKDPDDSIQNTIRIAFDSRQVNNEWKLAIKKY